MQNHGSFTLTPASCSQIGQWDAATRECSLTQDIPHPPVYIPEDVVTLNCRDPITGADHIVGSGTQASYGIYAYTISTATGNSVAVRNCNIRNVDIGVHAALPGFRGESISMTNAEPTGTGVILGAGTQGAGASLEAIEIDNFEVGVNAEQAQAITLRDLTVRTATSAFVIGGEILLEDAQVEGIPALDGGANTAGAVWLTGPGEPTLRRVTMSHLDGVFAGVWAVGGAAPSIEQLSVTGAVHGLVLDGPNTSSLTRSTVFQNEEGLWIRAGSALVFHNNIHSNQLNVRSDVAIELSDDRLGSPTEGQGNFWGRACPGPLFVASVDSNTAVVRDSHPFGQLNGWDSGGTPGCTANPDTVPPVAPILTFPISGAIVNDSSVAIAGTTEPQARVEIKEGMTTMGVVAADMVGAFLISLPFSGGAHTVVASATDASGNRSVDSAALNFSVLLVSDAAPSFDSLRVLKVTSVQDAQDPFVPSMGELNTVFVQGEMLQAAGAAGNHVWQANLRREIFDVVSGSVVAVRDASTLITKSTDPNRLGFRFALANTWDGRDVHGALSHAGPYVSKLTTWIIRDPVGLPVLPGTPPSGIPPASTCGPAAQPVGGACKVHQLPLLELTFSLLDVPPAIPAPVVTPIFRQELCNGIDDNGDGRIDEGACALAGCSGCVPTDCQGRRCVSAPDGCGALLACPCD